ncbi:MAG: biosynthetic-type acetolactate synthase large subunit [Planctomycetia bacterium]|nr:biosynthetic-type acetolactate synthase large subunit [Planctomycetia bacterium]
MSGAEIVVESLVRNKIDTLFAYPGGYTMPLHQVLTRYRDKIRVILPRHEQGGGFAAQGYARSTGKIGVCMTTSGPGATNMITSIADAKLDSIPLLAISGQVATNVIGSDGFQETPITEVCRSITKHHYLVTKIEDIARIIDEAIFVAMTGRPGPVLVDIPKDLQTTQCYPEFGVPMNLPGYSGKTPKPKPEEIDLLIEALHRAKRPVFFVGGGMVSSNACAEFLKAVEKTGVPVITSMTGLSAFPRDHHLALGMGGMHGGVYANKAIHESDLLIGLGVRFSDRVTGKVSEFAKGARLFQIDIDASEINKIKKTNYGLVADLLETMILLNKKLKDYQKPDLSGWYEKIEGWKKQYPLSYDHESPYILPEAAIEELSNATQDRKTIIATGVGQHQLWTTQFYHFSKPRTWLSSCGLGTMGFGLPAAMGAKIANPDALVVDIDGDGSLQMNIQEMATCHTEKIPVKIMLINNQHLGNVMQWEDRFYGSNRANTYLGMIDDPEAFGKGDGISPKVRYPDYAMIARGYGWDVISISRKKDLAAAIQEMINSPNPFLLDLATPYKEHVLPMTPPGGTIDNVILK